jgi:hypothetical protein
MTKCCGMSEPRSVWPASMNAAQLADWPRLAEAGGSWRKLEAWPGAQRGSRRDMTFGRGLSPLGRSETFGRGLSPLAFGT